MSGKIGRKEAIRQYKERRISRGVFAVKCAAAGRVWVDGSPNLEAWRNGSWFSLRHGGHPNKALQAVWDRLGAEAFEFEILETLDEKVAEMAVRDLLKEKKREWIGRLQAEPLT